MKGLVMAKRLQETSKVDFVIDLNLPQIMDITEDAREGHEEAEELFNDLAADTKDFVADWAGELLEWQTDQQAREEAAFLALADVLVDSVEMDGTSLRDIIGGPENWFMRRNPRNAASIRSLVVMQDAEE